MRKARARVTDRRALEAKLYRRLSAWAPIIALGMIVTGAALGGTVGRGAFMRQSIPYLLGDRGPSVAEVRANLPAALHSDGWLIAGYGLILAGCALFYRARASSRLGCHVANFVGLAPQPRRIAAPNDAAAQGTSVVGRR